MNKMSKQEIEAQRLMDAYDAYIFGAAGKIIPNFGDVSCVMAFNAFEACKAASRSYPVGSVDRLFWRKEAQNMKLLVY